MPVVSQIILLEFGSQDSAPCDDIEPGVGFLGKRKYRGESARRLELRGLRHQLASSCIWFRILPRPNDPTAIAEIEAGRSVHHGHQGRHRLRVACLHHYRQDRLIRWSTQLLSLEFQN